MYFKKISQTPLLLEKIFQTLMGQHSQFYIESDKVTLAK